MSGPVMAGFALLLLGALVAPIALLIVLGVRRKIRMDALFLGVSAFFVSQILLRLPLLRWLAGRGLWMDFALRHGLAYLLALALSAGLFEETARLAGGKLLRRTPDWTDALSFGLGHAFCETILLVSVTQINNLVLGALLHAGGTELLARWMPSSQVQTLLAQLAQATPGNLALSLIERLGTVGIHLGLTTLVFRGLVTRQARYYLMAVGLHTVVDFVAPLFVQIVTPVAAEALIVGFGLLGAAYLRRCQSRWFAGDLI